MSSRQSTWFIEKTKDPQSEEYGDNYSRAKQPHHLDIGAQLVFLPYHMIIVNALREGVCTY